MPKKRCHWYYDDGQPRQHTSGALGCPKGKKCFFVHPNDPEWDESRDSGPPPPGSTRHMSDVDHRPRPSTSTPVLSSERLASRPAPLRMSREPGEIEPSERRSIASPALSNTSLSFNEPSRTNGLSRVSRDSRIPSGPTSHPSSIPSRPLSVVDTDRMEPTRSEKMKTWVERIKLLSEAIMLRAEHLELERDLQKYHQLSSLWKYNDIPGGTRSDFKTHVSSLQDSCIAKKKELTALVHRLVETNYWNVNPPTSDDLLIHRMEMQASINQLRDNVQELYGLLRSLETKSMLPPPSIPPPSLPPPSVKPETQEEINRPAKRRRATEDDDSPPGPLRLPPDFKEVPTLTEKVMLLEDRVAELENEMVVHDNNLQKEAEEMVVIKLEEWERNRTPPIKRGTSGPSSEALEELPALASDIPGRLQALEGNFMRTGEEVGVVIEEVANLITGSEQTRRELESLREENAYLKNKVTELEQQQEESKQSIAKNEAELKALSTAVTALITQVHDAPPPSPLPMSQDLLFASYPAILQSVQRDLQSVIADMHKQVEERLQLHSQEFSSSIMNKLALTLQSMQAFSDWAASEKNKQGAPNGVNGVNGHSKAHNEPGG